MFRRWLTRLGALVACAAYAVSSRAEDPNTSATIVETAIVRRSIVAAVLERHPALRSSEHRAAALGRAGESAGSLPPPEAMVQIWQVPIAKPYAIDEAQMVMVGVGQTIPAIGARGARQRAAEYEADAERSVRVDIARQLKRDAEHAFADYVEATSRHRIHLEHRTVAERTAELARARHAGGGSLVDVTQAEVELARTEADVVTDGTRIEAARGRMNALLGRDALAPLGPPAIGEPETTAWVVRDVLAKARESRPELKALAARTDARREDARASEREALIPSFTVAALYFAPTSPMPRHGYGMNVSMSLPWIWGEARSKRDAQRESTAAAESDTLAARRPIEAEVAVQEANVRAAALRLLTLRDRVLPASRRAFDAAWAGYLASRTDILALVAARRAIVDVDSEIVIARAALDHALADLDAAAGAEIPRRTLDGARP